MKLVKLTANTTSRGAVYVNPEKVISVSGSEKSSTITTVGGAGGGDALTLSVVEGIDAVVEMLQS